MQMKLLSSTRNLSFRWSPQLVVFHLSSFPLLIVWKRRFKLSSSQPRCIYRQIKAPNVCSHRVVTVRLKMTLSAIRVTSNGRWTTVVARGAPRLSTQTGQAVFWPRPTSQESTGPVASISTTWSTYLPHPKTKKEMLASPMSECARRLRIPNSRSIALMVRIRILGR